MNATRMHELDKPCMLCNSINSQELFKFGEYTVVKCLRCGLGRTYPVPNRIEQDNINKSIYQVENRLHEFRKREKELVQRYERQLYELRQNHSKSAGKLLDVGCSTGFFLSSARGAGYEVYGVEVSEETGRYAREHYSLDIFIGTLESAHYPDKMFDVITLWDVIEHLEDPFVFLSEVRRILKDDGIVAIQSPNIESAMAHLTGRQWNWWTVPDHLFHFSPNSMSRLMENCGFQKIKMYTWEPGKDLATNLIVARLRFSSFGPSIKDKFLWRIVIISSAVIQPLLAPYQRTIWKRKKGGLVVIFASKAF